MLSVVCVPPCLRFFMWSSCSVPVLPQWLQCWGRCCFAQFFSCLCCVPYGSVVLGCHMLVVVVGFDGAV